MGKNQSKPSVSAASPESAEVPPPPAPSVEQAPSEPTPPAAADDEEPEPEARTKDQLEIRAVSGQGFWRDRRQYTRKPKLFDLDSFSNQELTRLEREVKAKNLIVKLVETPI